MHALRQIMIQVDGFRVAVERENSIIGIRVKNLPACAHRHEECAGRKTQHTLAQPFLVRNHRAATEGAFLQAVKGGGGGGGSPRSVASIAATRCRAASGTAGMGLASQRRIYCCNPLICTATLRLCTTFLLKSMLHNPAMPFVPCADHAFGTGSPPEIDAPACNLGPNIKVEWRHTSVAPHHAGDGPRNSPRALAVPDPAP